MATGKGWFISDEDEETVIYKMSNTQNLYVSRVNGGINIKVAEKVEESIKPLTLFIKFFGDEQLGIYAPKREQ